MKLLINRIKHTPHLIFFFFFFFCCLIRIDRNFDLNGIRTVKEHLGDHFMIWSRSNWIEIWRNSGLITLIIAFNAPYVASCHVVRRRIVYFHLEFDQLNILRLLFFLLSRRAAAAQQPICIIPIEGELKQSDDVPGSSGLRLGVDYYYRLTGSLASIQNPYTINIQRVDEIRGEEDRSISGGPLHSCFHCCRAETIKL